MGMTRLSITDLPFEGVGDPLPAYEVAPRQALSSVTSDRTVSVYPNPGSRAPIPLEIKRGWVRFDQVFPGKRFYVVGINGDLDAFILEGDMTLWLPAGQAFESEEQAGTFTVAASTYDPDSRLTTVIANEDVTVTQRDGIIFFDAVWTNYLTPEQFNAGAGRYAAEDVPAPAGPPSP
jgi:hypothetical protein